MTREEKVRVLFYLRAMEEMSRQEATCPETEDQDFVKEIAKGFEAQAAEIHALAESLQAEIGEMEITQPEQEEGGSCKAHVKTAPGAG